MRLAAVLIPLAAGIVYAHAPAPQATPLPQRLQAAVDAWQPQSGAPGVSVGVVTRDGTVLAATAGVADRRTGRALAVDDLMLAGSTGKTFFAALAVQLIEAGRLHLNDPVSKYLGGRPWFSRLPNAGTMTIRQVMTHTSGLVRYEMHPAFTAALRAEPDRVWTPEEQLSVLFDAEPPFAAGAGWDYSDSNYIVLAMVLEQVMSAPAYDEIGRRFLTPLGLTRVVPQTGRTIPGLAAGYAGDRDPLGFPDEMLQDGRLAINPRFEWGGGGFATSARDLARWGQALFAGAALSPAGRALMIDAGVPARLGPGTLYGLGVIIRPTTPVGAVVGHSGFFPGYMTELVHARDHGITVAVQVNTSAGVRGLLRFAYDVVALIRS